MTDACHEPNRVLQRILNGADAGLLHTRPPPRSTSSPMVGLTGLALPLWSRFPAPLALGKHQPVLESSPLSNPICIDQHSSPALKPSKVPITYSCPTTTRYILPACKKCCRLLLYDLCGPWRPFPRTE